MGQRLTTSRTSRSTSEKTDHGHIPQRPNGRTPRQRRNDTTSHAMILVALNENLANGLCLGVCNLPTEQNPHAPTENPHLLHPNDRKCSPLPTHLPRSHHPTPQEPRTRRGTNDRRPRLHLRSCLSPLLNDSNWPGNCPTLSRQHVSMVRPAL